MADAMCCHMAEAIAEGNAIRPKDKSLYEYEETSFSNNIFLFAGYCSRGAQSKHSPVILKKLKVGLMQSSRYSDDLS